MRIIIAKDYTDMSEKAASMVAAQILLKPNSVLGLATGSTPLQMYRELIRRYKVGELDFEEITTFNLDEYIGLGKSNINSYNHYMYDNFFRHINISLGNVNIPDGMAIDIERECKDYENRIQERGGIDLQVLGIGNNGHIGFNEPNLKFEATTHLVELDEGTINANSRFFNAIEDVPKQAISMGIKTIMQSRKILLLASGKSKAEAIYKAIYDGITPEVPASILQLHPDVTIIVDRDAAVFIRGQLLHRSNIAVQR